MDRFFSPPPEVHIVNIFQRPFDNAVATARTCYSSTGIITPEEVGGEGIQDPILVAQKHSRRDELAKSIYQAGHHTTLQHAHVQFALRNVSRQFLWSFLHSHPYYNSEQVSQRYVEVKPGSFAIPPLSDGAREVYERTIETQIAAYRRLTEVLTPVVAQEYYGRFPARKNRSKRYGKEIKRKAMEIARYVLPVATFAYLYHTVSVLTLLRYYRICQAYDAPFEQRLVVEGMVGELLKVDPLYQAILEEPLPIEVIPEYRFYAEHRDAVSRGMTDEVLREFDGSLHGYISKLIDYKINNERVLADSVREVLGITRSLLSNTEAISLALNPGQNTLLGEALNLATLSKLSRTLFHPSYTFRKKLSHTADSQDQRHRMTPASRPCLHAHLTETPDVIVPELVKQSEEARALCEEIMGQTWEGINRLREMNVPDEFVMYLLPNAVAIRFTESADLLNLHHKHAMRLCYNSQEEIWRASLDEALQIREVNPEIGKYLLPPCTLRAMAEARPICPEGERFCGIIVWRKDLSEFERMI